MFGMPTVYRSMKRGQEDGLPVVGTNSKELGVRVLPNPVPDVDLDGDACVILNGKGMSVADHWSRLPAHLIPKRLRPISGGATGSDQLTCYRLGSGPFAAGPMNDGLAVALKGNNPHAGNITPSQSVTIQRFQAALAATRLEWQADETEP